MVLKLGAGQALALAARPTLENVIGSPANIARMLEFAARHDIKPVIENFPMEQVNDAMARLRSAGSCSIVNRSVETIRGLRPHMDRSVSGADCLCAGPMLR